MKIFSYVLMIYTCEHCYSEPHINIVMHGGECTVNVDHCEAGTFCLLDRNNVSRCLCKADQYRSQFNSCLSTSNLLVTEVKTKQVTPNSVTLEWSNRTIYTESAKIKVSYGNTDYKFGKDRGITIYKLEQDTTYNFTLQVVIHSVAWYSARDGPKYFHNARTTNKKYHGDPCNRHSDVCQDETSCVLDVNNISRCLCDDNQFRDDDNKCVSIAELKVKNVHQKLITTDSIQLAWCDTSFNKYTAQFNVSYGTGAPVRGDSYGVTVNHLTLKTLYTISVKVFVPIEDFYGIKSGPPETLKITTVSAENETFRSKESDCRTTTRLSENVISSSTSTSSPINISKIPISSTLIPTIPILKQTSTEELVTEGKTYVPETNKYLKTTSVSTTSNSFSPDTTLTKTKVTTAKTSTNPATSTQISESVSTASNTKTNTTMADNRDSKNIIIVVPVCITVVLVVIILLSLLYTHHRKKKNLQFRNSITSSGGTFKHVSYSISQECTYSEIDQQGLRNSKETQKNGNECNAQTSMPATNDYETAQSITYSEVNHLKKSNSVKINFSSTSLTDDNVQLSQREHNGAEYSHLANISNQRSRNTENVYDG